MRWTLLALLGAALTVIGIVDLSRELMHGADIWRRHNLGVGLVIPGAYCVWKGLSERASGGENHRPIWPAVTLLAVLAATTAGLYALSPAAAVLFLIVVLPFGLAAKVTRWFGDD